jgi:hypothetical protein
MENLKELKNKFNLLHNTYTKLCSKFTDKLNEDIPFDIAYKWFCNQPIVKEYKLLIHQIQELEK